ncbi:MAG: lysoplasmalogenase [Chitinophagia bacterium]
MNKRLPQIIIILFFLTLFVHLFAIASQMPAIRVITKLLLLPLLIIYLLTSTPNKTAIKKMALLALFFSWLGDVALTQNETNFFLFGMLAFNMTHIQNGKILLRLHPFRLLGATWIGLGLALGTISLVYYFLQYSLETFLIPVVVYMLVISAVWVLSFNLTNQPRYKTTATNFFVPGMFLFVLSDTLLALNKFLFHYPLRWDMWVMVTYALAQWFLTEGYIRVVNVAGEESNP